MYGSIPFSAPYLRHDGRKANISDFLHGFLMDNEPKVGLTSVDPLWSGCVTTHMYVLL